MAHPVDHELIGQTLGLDVRDTRGSVLLKAGTRLDAKHLRTLKLWGIRGVTLASEVKAAAGTTSIDRKQVERHAVEERRRFSRCDLGHPLMHQLYLLAVRRRAEAAGGAAQ